MIPQPQVKVIYNGTNITEDISKYLVSLTYSDKVEGQSDEISLVLDDTEGNWRGSWYPEKGAKLVVEISYKGQKLKCGTFEIDEISVEWPPYQVSIRGLAAGITKALRTKNHKGYDKTNLRGIAQSIASKYGLTLQGTIEAIPVERITQHNEKDLAFLRRIAAEYGYTFNIRNNTMTFTSMYELEKGKDVTEIDATEVVSGSLRDKAVEVYKDAKVQYKNPKTNQVVQSTVKTDQIYNKDDIGFTKISSGDTANTHIRAENKQQATAKAKALLYRQNMKQNEGRLSLEGNTLLVAGINFMLTGLGVLSGKYHVLSSTHSVSRDSGYQTEIEVKRVGGVKAKAQQKAKKPKPVATQASTSQTTTITNNDGVNFTKIK